MRLTVQRKLAAQMLKCSASRVVFDKSSLELVKEAITKADIRALINSGAITEKPVVSNSRGRIRKNQAQKTKGLRKGQGSRKGTANARESTKETWIKKVRAQRSFIKQLKEKLTVEGYRGLYRKVKGGFFRNRRHIKLFIEDKEMIQK